MAIAGMDDEIGDRARVVGDRVRVRPLDDGHVSGAHQHGIAVVGHDPGVPAQRRGQGEGGAVVDAQAPRRIEDGLAERARARANPVQEVSKRIHAPIVDAQTWNRGFQIWIISLHDD